MLTNTGASSSPSGGGKPHRPMLAKVPIKRLDGKTSFAALVNYIARHASAVRWSDNIVGPESAAAEMESVACRNERVKDAVYHYVLSWQAGEAPTDPQAFDAVTATLTALNMREHQWLSAVHRNTQHAHVHVAVNRVNPMNFRSVYPKGDWLALDHTCRALEIEQGWKHSPGPHRVEIGAGLTTQIVRFGLDRDDTTAAVPTSKARNFTVWQGHESFQEWVAKAPADSLKRVLERSDATWRDVHRALQGYALEYRIKGSGAVIVDRSESEKLHAKASHLGRFASRKQLEARLGTFEGPQGAPLENTSKSYRIEVIERGLAASRRDGDRATLYSRFRQESVQWRQERAGIRKFAWEQQRESERVRYAALSAKKRDTLKELRTRLPDLERRHLQSIAAMNVARTRQALLARIGEERTELRTRLLARGPGPWRAWLAREADAGDMVASRELRRLRYRQSYDRKVDVVGPEIGAAFGSEPPNKTISNELRWFADAFGVHYVRDSRTIFSDEGRRVVFRHFKEDDISLGLALAREKWASGLSLAGNESFRKTATMLADRMGIAIRAGALRNELPDVEVLSRRFGKPIRHYDPSVSARLSGQVVDAGVDSDGLGRVVIDTGLVLSVIRTNAKIAAGLVSEPGKRIRAVWGRELKEGPSSDRRGWRIFDLERTGPERSPSIGI